MTDNKGRTVNFKNAIIIMTSNIGAEYIRSRVEVLNKNENVDKELYDDIKKNVMQVLKEAMRPEFLNRVDDIIVFHPLDKDHIKEIVKLQFENVTRILSQKQIKVKVTDNALDYLTRNGYDPVFGARPLKRLIQKEVINYVAKEIIAGKVKEGQKISVDSDGSKIII